MSLYTDIPGIDIQVSRDVVVASIQVDLDEDVLARFRDDLLRSIHETSSSRVILDVSGLEPREIARRVREGYRLVVLERRWDRRS